MLLAENIIQRTFPDLKHYIYLIIKSSFMKKTNIKPGMKSVITFLIAITLIHCKSEAQMRLIWEKDSLAYNPESIVFDKSRACCYVSNFGENPGNGMSYSKDYISKFNLKGEILEQKMVDNVTAPTGLCIHNDLLYIVERFGIIEFDLRQNKVVKRYRIEGPGFLNDIAADNNGNLYVTVSDTNIIYRIKDSIVEKWIESDEFMNPNGIISDGDNIIVGVCSDGSLRSVSIHDKKTEIISAPGKGFAVIDGVKKHGDGYFISHYQGIIYFVNNKGVSREILNTTAENVFCADFEFIEDQKLFFIPTLQNNKVRLYRYE